MKKFLMVLALASVSVAGMAQETTEKYSVATNSFWSNWFIQANVAGTAFYSSQENNLNLSNSPLKGFRNNLGASVAIGKWFTPGLGLRTKVNGVWGRTVNGDDKKANASKYWQANEQVLFNLSNMLCGYNPDRVWNFIPYAGAGIGRNMTYNSYAMGLQAGLLNEFRLSRKFALNLDLSFGLHEPDFDGNGIANASSRSPKSKDRDLNLEIGLTYNLGKATWNKVPDVDAINALHQSQLDALNAQLADANAENDRLNNLIKNHKCPEAPKVRAIAPPATVYFYCDKTKSGPSYSRDLVDVRALAKYAMEQGADVLVTGYADSATGKPDHNQWLSDERAKTVVEEVVGVGVNRSKITAVGKGGVDILSPFELNRRATVEVR